MTNDANKTDWKDQRLFVPDIAARFGLAISSVQSYASSSDPKIAARVPPVHRIQGLRAIWWVESEVKQWEAERESVRRPGKARGRPRKVAGASNCE